jgi:galactokinase
MHDVEKLFRNTFQQPSIALVQAPGRLELLGNHTDYNQGLVLALAIDRAVRMALAPRRDGRVELVSSAFPERVTFSAHEFRRDPAAPWTDYVKGVLSQLRERGVHFGGFSAAIHSTIPFGAGLSSSAALEVATALAVRRLYPYALRTGRAATPPQRLKGDDLPLLTPVDKIEIARLCQAAESGFVGVNCGLLDPLSSLFGKAFHAIEIDCQSLAIDLLSMAGEIAIVVCNTGVKHALVGGEYNALRAHCEAAARALGVASLRSVDMPMLTAQRAKLSERQYQCAFHVVGEIQRVVFGARALRDSDFAQFGQYMLQSHESSRDFFHNSCAELDVLVELARSQPGCLGARLTGGGFGGATINLVQRDQVPSFTRIIAERYQQHTGITLEPMVCQIADGAF